MAIEMPENATAQLVRTIDPEPPVELTREEHIDMLLSYVQRNFADQGMCADVAV